MAAPRAERGNSREPKSYFCARGSATSSIVSSSRSRPPQVSRRIVPATCSGMPPAPAACRRPADPRREMRSHRAASRRLPPGHTDVRLADDLGEFDPVRGKREFRLRIALPVGPRALQAGQSGHASPPPASARHPIRGWPPPALQSFLLRRRSLMNPRKSSSLSRATVKPAAMAWPPPLIRIPSAVAARTAEPISTPATERSEPVPDPCHPRQ